MKQFVNFCCAEQTMCHLATSKGRRNRRFLATNHAALSSRAFASAPSLDRVLRWQRKGRLPIIRPLDWTSTIPIPSPSTR